MGEIPTTRNLQAMGWGYMGASARFLNIAGWASGFACCVAVLASGSASAYPLNPRPVAEIEESHHEPSLQEVLDGLSLEGPSLEAERDQLPVALFEADDDEAWVTLIAEIAGFASRNELGLYSPLNQAKRVRLFEGSDDVGDAVGFHFDHHDLYVEGVLAAEDFGKTFGFYLETPQGNIFFSEDERNGGAAQALVFGGHSGREHEPEHHEEDGRLADLDSFLVAWEDLILDDSDRDYQDLIFEVSGVEPIVATPEPASAWLLGLGIGISAWIGWARRAEVASA